MENETFDLNAYQLFLKPKHTKPDFAGSNFLNVYFLLTEKPTSPHSFPGFRAHPVWERCHWALCNLLALIKRSEGCERIVEMHKFPPIFISLFEAHVVNEASGCDSSDHQGCHSCCFRLDCEDKIKLGAANSFFLLGLKLLNQFRVWSAVRTDWCVPPVGVRRLVLLMDLYQWARWQSKRDLHPETICGGQLCFWGAAGVTRRGWS